MSDTRPSRSLNAIPLAVHLFRLMLFVLLPCLVFSIALIIRNDGARRDQAYARAEIITFSISESFQRETDRMRLLLQALSTKNHLANSNFEQMHSDAVLALEGSKTHFIVLDEDFNQIINSRVPFGEPLGAGSEIETAQRARETGEIEMSDLFFGRTSGNVVFNMVKFMPRESGDIYLIINQNASDLVQSVGTPMPEGWQYAILDPRTQYAAGSVGLETGQRFPFPEWVDRELSPAGRILEHENRRYLVSSRYLPRNDWTVVTWVPSRIVEAPLRRTWMLVVLAGVVLLLISVVTAAAGAYYLAKPIRKLAADAHDLGDGRKVRSRYSRIIEIDQVSREIAHASRELARRQEENEFLLHEVTHRAKNQLTVVGALARQNLRGSNIDPTITEAFLNRIHALSLSLDRLAGRKWHAVSMKSLIETQLESFRTDNPAQIVINGPDIEVRPDAAQALGLATHELATNAAKYGALNGPGGKVSVSWARERRAGEPDEGGETTSEDVVIIVWREQGGPPVTPPERSGFGSTIIGDYLEKTLEATVVRDFATEGFLCRITIPNTSLLPHTGGH